MKPSFNPDDFVEGGGLPLNDVEATIVTARYATQDYAGKFEPSPAVKITYQVGDATEDQYYSIGSSSMWVVRSNGLEVDSTEQNRDGRFSKKANWPVFCTELVKAGYDKARLLNGEITQFDGLQVHLIRIPQIDFRTGKPMKDAKDREKTMPIVDRILALPGEKKAGGGAASSDDAVIDKAVEIISKAIEDAGGALEKKALPGKILMALKGTKGDLKTKVTTLCLKDEFLGGRDEWNYEDGVLVAA